MKLEDRLGDLIFIPSGYVPKCKSRVLLRRRRRTNNGVKLTVSATNFSDSSDFLVNPEFQRASLLLCFCFLYSLSIPKEENEERERDEGERRERNLLVF